MQIKKRNDYSPPRYQAVIRLGRGGKDGHSSAIFPTKKKATEWALKEEARLRKDLKKKPQGSRATSLSREPFSNFLRLRMKDKITRSPDIDRGGGYTEEQFKAKEYLREPRFRDFRGNIERLVKEPLFNKPVSSITPDELYEYFKEKTKKMTAKSVQRNYWTDVYAAFKLAKSKKAIEENPLEVLMVEKGIKRTGITGKPKKKKAPRVSRETIKKLKEACAQEKYKHAITIAVETAIRPSEFIRLKWAFVDFDSLEFHLEADETKGRIPRTVPISPEAFEALKALRKLSQTEFVFDIEPTHESTFKNERRRIVKRAGLKKFDWRWFRHEAVYRLLSEKRLPVNQVAEISGHTTTEIFDHYAGGNIEASKAMLWGKHGK